MRSSALALALTFAPVAYAETPTAQDAELFTKQVRPLLEKHCFACHSHAANKSKGQLMVDSRGALLKGGESGPAVDVKEPGKSLLLRAISYEDDDLRMPPKGKMPDADIAVLEDWVRRGSPWAGVEKHVVKGSRVPGQISAADRDWWAYRPVKPVTPPTVAEARWHANPIDRFIRARLDREGLKPSPPAERAALIRRVYFDLIGLPPSPEQVDAFVKDPDPRAYEKLVDELLASPRYGERMARHWLDLVRYAESDGFRLDAYRPSAWRYRDYVIQSFNADKPYDQFIREQLAGDEANPGNADAIIATGFLAGGIYEYNQRDVRSQWSDMVNEVTDVTADVFLAMGMGCARCHDHKFDPILQKDYYRLRAFFEPIVILQEEEVATPAQRREYQARLKVWLDNTKEIRARIGAIEAPEREAIETMMNSKFPPDIRAMIAKTDGERTPFERQIATLAYRQIAWEFEKLDTKIKGETKDRYLELRRELAKFDKDRPQPLPRAQLARDIGAEAPPTIFPKKGADPIEPGFPSVLDENPASVTPTGFSTGRRLALANWIASSENPLSARVMVNRLWQYHFGRGLAATASDFGHLGEAPSHPELLDWLADQFVKEGWSIKKMHRLMVTSQAYRQSAVHLASADALKKDPENVLLWRGGTHRLQAEQIRDVLLAVTGKLDLSAGGPSVEPREPRRTIYAKVQRNLRDSLLDVYDWPEGFTSTSERNVTTTASQSLLMLNSAFMQQQARALAERIRGEKHATEAAQVERIFRLLFGRFPSAAEQKLALSFLGEQPSRIQPVKQSGPNIELSKLPLREGKAIVLSPGTGPVRMMVPDSKKIPRGDFTLEGYVLLRSTFDDGTVRTIASFWDGDQKAPGGWSFGVTSKKSAYKPQMLVLQLWGENAAGQKHYEPVFSGLAIGLNKPYYVAVAVNLDDPGDTGVTFYAKDLTNDEEPVQVYQTTHKVVKMLPRTGHFAIGGADHSNERSWDGLIDEVRLSSAMLRAEQLLLSSETVRDDTVGFWQFESSPGALKDSSRNGLHLTRQSATATGAVDGRFIALTDLCLTLLNANELVYVD